MDVVLICVVSILFVILALFNTLLLIGIAGSLAKLIKYFNGEEQTDRERGRGLFVTADTFRCRRRIRPHMLILSECKAIPIGTAYLEKRRIGMDFP